MSPKLEKQPLRSSLPHAPHYHPEALLRLSQIIGNPKAKPPILPLYPVSRSAFYLGIQKGIYPSPVKSPTGKMSFWRYKDIKKLLESLSHEGEKS